MVNEESLRKIIQDHLWFLKKQLAKELYIPIDQLTNDVFVETISVIEILSTDLMIKHIDRVEKRKKWN
ncbi:hypothetical protein IM538_18510 [Cytobacillus suaedae]|nr:hypothetical protein IM538_18510 [Cytobacillus suaedae]